MKKYIAFIICHIAILSFSYAQNNPIQTIQVFPYQHSQEAKSALNDMDLWNQNDWSSFFKLLEDSSTKVKATYAIHAYTNHIALTNKSNAFASVLKKQIRKTKNDYAKIALQDELNLLTDSTTTNLRNQKLPSIKTVLPQKEIVENPVQALLHLEDQMQIASNPIEQKHILVKASKIAGFSSFVFVSHYLHNEMLQNEAALIVSRLALQDPQIKGPFVRSTLETALPLIKGVDSAIVTNKLQSLLKSMPYDYGFENLFNEKDLTGWKGLVGNPIYRSQQADSTMKSLQDKADEKMRQDWVVKDGLLIFTGHGDNLCTTKQYGDFELYVDWKITEKGDAGIYLRGSPQVQIWDTSRREVGAEVGSGGLYNNQKYQSKPLVVADNAIGSWNRFHIIMKGEKVTVYLNGQLVTDHVVLENYWDRSLPIFVKEQIELQAHGTYVAYRNLYIRNLPNDQPLALSEEEKKQGFESLFDGSHLDKWMGNLKGYIIKDGVVEVVPDNGSGGNLYTKEEYADFSLRFEFQLTPGANNGIGIHAPPTGDAAYDGMEIQVLDNEAPIYKNLQPYQYHGSVYGISPAKRGFLLPTGAWNIEEIIVKGNKIKVILNDTLITDADITDAKMHGTMDHKAHPGLERTMGHIGFLGHGDVVRFKNIRIKRF